MNHALGRLLAVLLLACLPIASSAAEPLRLNSGVGAPYFQADKKGFLDLLVPELFRRIGVVAEAVQYAASERAMINANDGIDDGVALRIRGLEKTYPNLVLIEEKILDNDFVAYSRKTPFATTGFDTLKNRQVGYITGWKIFESKLLPETPVTRVGTAEQLFNLLVGDRADLILFERWQGNHILRERGIDATALSPPLATTEMYMYLHKKHAHLAQPAARALRAMKADGTWRRIAAQALPGFDRK